MCVCLATHQHMRKSRFLAPSARDRSHPPIPQAWQRSRFRQIGRRQLRELRRLLILPCGIAAELARQAERPLSSAAVDARSSIQKEGASTPREHVAPQSEPLHGGPPRSPRRPGMEARDELARSTRIVLRTRRRRPAHRNRRPPANRRRRRPGSRQPCSLSDAVDEAVPSEAFPPSPRDRPHQRPCGGTSSTFRR